MHPRQRLIFLFLLLSVTLRAQIDTLPAFPEDFTGKWSGTLEVFSPAGLAQSVPMELHILPVNDTTYTYAIIYGEDKTAGKRDYLIRRGPSGPHHWICDEQNTILLDGYYVGGVYQSVFTVAGNYLISNLEHHGDHLLYSIQVGKESAVRTTGNAEHGGEDIPEVKSFGVSGYQRARLRRAGE